MRWHCWFLGEDVHGLRDIPRDSHQELRAPIHLPSELRSSQLFYRNNSYNCSTGTTLMTVLQDQQLNSSWTAELLKSRTLVGSLFCISIEAVAFDRLLKLSHYYCNFGAQLGVSSCCKPVLA